MLVIETIIMSLMVFHLIGCAWFYMAEQEARSGGYQSRLALTASRNNDLGVYHRR